MAGVGGAAVPGRLWLAGTEARPTGLFSYKLAVNGWHRLNIHGHFLATHENESPCRGGFKTRPYAWTFTVNVQNHKCFTPEDEKSPLPPFSKGGSKSPFGKGGFRGI